MARKRVKIPSRPGGRKKGNSQKELMKQISQMQEQFMEAQSELEEKEFTASSGGGAVEATVKGSLVLSGLKIDPDAVDEDDIEMLEDMIIAAVSEAQRQAQDAQNSQTANLTGDIPGLDGLNIPGL